MFPTPLQMYVATPSAQNIMPAGQSPNHEPSGRISALNVACAITSWPNIFPPPTVLVSIAGNPYFPDGIALLVSLKVIDPAFSPSIFYFS
jgi:hypothetical protein